jgi:hypothetical protein
MGRAGEYAMADNSTEPERPRQEPEIIPPDRARTGPDWRQPAWRPHGWSGTGTQRVYVARVGPFGVAMLMLAFAILGAVIFLAIIGAVLIWIPVVALLVVVAAIFRVLRR